MSSTQRRLRLLEKCFSSNRASYSDPELVRRGLEIDAAAEGKTLEEFLADVHAETPNPCPPDMLNESWSEFLSRVEAVFEVDPAELRADIDEMIDTVRRERIDSRKFR